MNPSRICHSSTCASDPSRPASSVHANARHRLLIRRAVDFFRGVLTECTLVMRPVHFFRWRHAKMPLLARGRLRHIAHQLHRVVLSTPRSPVRRSLTTSPSGIGLTLMPAISSAFELAMRLCRLRSCDQAVEYVLVENGPRRRIAAASNSASPFRPSSQAPTACLGVCRSSVPRSSVVLARDNSGAQVEAPLVNSARVVQPGSTFAVRIVTRCARRRRLNSDSLPASI